jgi:hypothetical protein
VVVEVAAADHATAGATIDELLTADPETSGRRLP